MQNAQRLMFTLLTIGSAMIAAAHAATPTTSPAAAPATAPATAPVTRPAPRLGIMLMDLRHYADAERQIAAFGGTLIVNAVAPGSRAERMGFRVADVVKRVNGNDVATVADVIAAVQAAVQAAQALEIEVLRDGVQLLLRETPANR